MISFSCQQEGLRGDPVEPNLHVPNPQRPASGQAASLWDWSVSVNRVGSHATAAPLGNRTQGHETPLRRDPGAQRHRDRVELGSLSPSQEGAGHAPTRSCRVDRKSLCSPSSWRDPCRRSDGWGRLCPARCGDVARTVSRWESTSRLFGSRLRVSAGISFVCSRTWPTTTRSTCGFMGPRSSRAPTCTDPVVTLPTGPALERVIAPGPRQPDAPARPDVEDSPPGRAAAHCR